MGQFRPSMFSRRGGACYVAPYSLRNDSASRPALTSFDCLARFSFITAQSCAARAASASALLGSGTSTQEAFCPRPLPREAAVASKARA